MALTIATLDFTGSSGNKYTVPSGKIAKVTINYLYMANNAIISIGDYKLKNGATGDVYSMYQSLYSAHSQYGYPPVNGYIKCHVSASSMQSQFVYVRESHILIAGQTIVPSNGNITFKANIFEEDA